MIESLNKFFTYKKKSILTTINDMTLGKQFDEVGTFINEAITAQLCLKSFVSDCFNSKFVSLGQNCSTSWYLKQLGLKKESFPFDWIFSSPEIIRHCINDNFDRFLDKKLIYQHPSGNSAGHQYYHSKMFNHRNPLKSNEDYLYYDRCCERFLRLMGDSSNIVYVITLINEPQKRGAWRSGFDCSFKMPIDQDISTLNDLILLLLEKTNNARFIIVDHYTNTRRHVCAKQMNDHIYFLKYCAGGSSTGLYYSDNLDDFCFKLILTGLC